MQLSLCSSNNYTCSLCPFIRVIKGDHNTVMVKSVVKVLVEGNGLIRTPVAETSNVVKLTFT